VVGGVAVVAVGAVRVVRVVRVVVAKATAATAAAALLLASMFKSPKTTRNYVAKYRLFHPLMLRHRNHNQTTHNSHNPHTIIETAVTP
jgi:transcription initiation factor TFIIIB Brf1 subunit/transcription initiation factor TFIIB